MNAATIPLSVLLQAAAALAAARRDCDTISVALDCGAAEAALRKSITGDAQVRPE